MGGAVFQNGPGSLCRDSRSAHFERDLQRARVEVRVRLHPRPGHTLVAGFMCSKPRDNKRFGFIGGVASCGEPCEPSARPKRGLLNSALSTEVGFGAHVNREPKALLVKYRN
jgi:hypothetical protein